MRGLWTEPGHPTAFRGARLPASSSLQQLLTPRFKRDYEALMRKHYDESKFVKVLALLMAEESDPTGRANQDGTAAIRDRR